MENILREFIQNFLIESEEPLEYSQEFIEAVNDYVRDSRVSVKNIKKTNILMNWVKSSMLPPGLTLQRVSSTDPKYNVGDRVSFLPLASFTTVDLSSGKSAGNIAWKSYDACIIQIENPLRGWKVDYNIVNVLFDASSEKEVIVSGEYVVVEKRMIPEPGTLPQYGYEIPLYILREV